MGYFVLCLVEDLFYAYHMFHIKDMINKIS